MTLKKINCIFEYQLKRIIKMKKDELFPIVLSKNRLSRELKQLYKKNKQTIPSFVYFDFEEIEKAIGTQNQPTAKEIFDSKMDI